ncbi:MAG: hypothetical protein AAGF12_28980 [Myxococcota bacterium]
MSRVHVGASIERMPGPKYREHLRFAELALRAPLPRRATLTRWRKETPEPVLAVLAPESSVVSEHGPLRDSDQLTAGKTWLAEAAAALEATAVVVCTDGRVSTGQRDRDRLRGYFDSLNLPEGCRPVWIAGGLWEAEDAFAFAERMGVIHGSDPLEADPLGDVYYGRIRGIGMRTRISEGMLMEVEARLSALAASEAFVSIESERSVGEAEKLAAMLA